MVTLTPKPSIHKTVKLPSGMEVFCLDRNEASWLYEEVKGYVSNGIELHPGAVVLDVGANVGMFALFVNQLLNNNVTVYSFEPIPTLFNILQSNIDRYNPKGLKAFCYGLAEHSATVEFEFYPNASALSNAFSGESVGKDLARDILVRHPEHAPFPGRGLRWFPTGVRAWVFDNFSEIFFKAERVTCQLRPLSEVIAEQQIDRIDLLKVDVEKSELTVLLGLQPQDWQKIQQAVIEVYDIDQRVDTIVNLLKSHGFTSITVKQEALFEGSQNFNVFARR
jgi:FkbM family methyltransferase